MRILNIMWIIIKNKMSKTTIPLSNSVMKYPFPRFILGSILNLNYYSMFPFAPNRTMGKYFNTALIRIIIPENIFPINPEKNPGEIDPRSDISHIKPETAPNPRPSPPPIPDYRRAIVAY